MNKQTNTQTRRRRSNESLSHANPVEDLHGVIALRFLVLDEHDATKRAHSERLDPVEVADRRRVLYTSATPIHHRRPQLPPRPLPASIGYTLSWLRGSVVERRSSAGELSLSCARPVADG